MKFRWLALLFSVSCLVAGGCGALDSGAYEEDDTCFDCRTVCEGTSGDAMEACLAQCVECEGYSGCFAWMEGRFDGMALSMSEWTEVDCDKLNITRHR